MSAQKILVIDDDETLHEILKAILDKNGFEYLGAMDGPEGLEVLAANDVDGILLDRMMPEMDGNDVLEKIKSDPFKRETPVIMLTGQNDIAEVSTSLELGAEDYVVKPFDDTNLVIRLKHALNS